MTEIIFLSIDPSTKIGLLIMLAAILFMAFSVVNTTTNNVFKVSGQSHRYVSIYGEIYKSLSTDDLERHRPAMEAYINDNPEDAEGINFLNELYKKKCDEFKAPALYIQYAGCANRNRSNQ